MPEGDTVFLAATRLRAALQDRVLTRTDFRVPAIATVDLAGQKVEDVAARGKHLLFRFEEGLTLHTHFKMEGSWHVYPKGARWRSPAFQARAVLENASWTCVGFRLAVTELIPTGSEDQVVGHLGPDPLGIDWDQRDVLRRMLAQPDRSIGETILDQEVIAGPGNVYKCEVCFLKGIDPLTPVAKVPDPEALVTLLKRLMDANRTTGSQITTGNTRKGQTSWVYGRSGKPCRRCGTAIVSETQPGYGGDRITYWCPRCQPRGT